MSFKRSRFAVRDGSVSQGGYTTKIINENVHSFSTFFGRLQCIPSRRPMHHYSLDRNRRVWSRSRSSYGGARSPSATEPWYSRKQTRPDFPQRKSSTFLRPELSYESAPSNGSKSPILIASLTNPTHRFYFTWLFVKTQSEYTISTTRSSVVK